MALRIASDWPLADNHIYLLAYWCLAVSLAVGTMNADTILASSSRLLVGVAFALAVLWKGVLAPDFLDGRFFRVTLMTDPRFQEASMLIGGLSRSQIASNVKALAALPEGAEPIEPPEVVEPARIRAFAAVSTWGILALEVCVAVAMLAPLPVAGWATALRHGTLLTFCLVTYALAPVAGFGWLLLVMGLTQSGRRSVLTGLYVSAFLLVLFYTEVPWAGLMLDYFAGPS